MILTILGIVGPILIRLLGYWVSNSKMSEEAKQRFFEFVKKAGEDMGSTKLMQYGDKQLAWLKDPKNPWKEGVA